MSTSPRFKIYGKKRKIIFEKTIGIAYDINISIREYFSMSVGRPRKFDTQEVLIKSIDVFWANGYSNTSFADLERATGLHRQSICYAFGDKHSLFVKCLESYCESGWQQMNLAANDAVSSIDIFRKIFEYWMDEVTDVEERGCFILNAISEMAHRDVIIKEIIRKSHDDMLVLLSEIVKKGIENNEIKSELTPDFVALQYLSMLDGLILELKIGRPRQDVYDSFELFIKMIKA